MQAIVLFGLRRTYRSFEPCAGVYRENGHGVFLRDFREINSVGWGNGAMGVSIGTCFTSFGHTNGGGYGGTIETLMRGHRCQY